jgi:hypothetical protein
MQETMPSIESSIKQQLDINKSKNLLFENATQIMNIDSSFLAALEDYLNYDVSKKAEDVSSELVSFTTNEFVKRLYSINPYLRVSKVQIENLNQIYRETWQMMRKTKSIKATLNEFHYPQLSQWLATLYPVKFQKVLKLSSSVGNVTYGEYSAELQVKLLGIDTSYVNQPILDFGCGGQANLVTYFRSRGIEAYGIDRHLEIQKPYLDQVDWFDYHFKPGQWGTIVAHMSFTNHLNYAYLNDISQLEHYLLKMKEILESLLISGSFHYAPSLPFIEDKLSTEIYRVQSEPKFGDMLVSIIIRTE